MYETLLRYKDKLESEIAPTLLLLYIYLYYDNKLTLLEPDNYSEQIYLSLCKLFSKSVNDYNSTVLSYLKYITAVLMKGSMIKSTDQLSIKIKQFWDTSSI